MGFFGGGGGTTPVNMVGASTGTAGTAGYVPAPAQRNQFTCLAGDATFKPAMIRPNIAAFASTRYYAPIGARSDYPLVTFPSFLTTAYCTPIYLKDGTIDKLGIQLGQQFASSSTNYVALYDSDSDGKPSSLLTNSTANSFTTTGTTDDNKFKVITLSTTLQINAGLYYSALFGSSSSNQFRGIVQSAESSFSFFYGVDVSATPAISHVNFPFVITISGSTFPTTASATISNQGQPSIYVHYT